MTVLVGHDRRTVLVSAMHGKPVAESMTAALEELAGLGYVAIARPCPAGFDVLLSRAGQAEARRQWSACWWMRWRDLAAAVDARPASTFEARMRLTRLSKRARDRALVAFAGMSTGVASEG